MYNSYTLNDMRIFPNLWQELSDIQDHNNNAKFPCQNRIRFLTQDTY